MQKLVYFRYILQTLKGMKYFIYDYIYTFIYVEIQSVSKRLIRRNRNGVILYKISYSKWKVGYCYKRYVLIMYSKWLLLCKN